MKIKLSQYEVSKIVAEHFMDSPQFPEADELLVRFEINTNLFGKSTLTCTVEEV